MININNKKWDQLGYDDIQNWLNNKLHAEGQENFFFEFKSDEVDNRTFIKEVSAFSNTYGGYILIGIEDDTTIKGCKKWMEERIHTTIYDSITPLPIFDVKTLNKDDSISIIIVKIEQGPIPPYITNSGKIYERVSSGSVPINNSEKLAQLYRRNSDSLSKLEKTIELPAIELNGIPQNVYGYIDMGFHIEFTHKKDISQKWINFDSSGVLEYLQSTHNAYSVSRIGNVYCVSVGKIEVNNQFGDDKVLNAGANNFIEISSTGAVRSRVLLCGNQGKDTVNLAVAHFFRDIIKGIYQRLFGEELSNRFIYARKYESLTVLKQFVPMYFYTEGEELDIMLNKYLDEHKKKYGNNIVIVGNRIPSSNYTLIDRRYFDEFELTYNDEHLIDELFDSRYFNLGFIDIPSGMRDWVEGLEQREQR